MFSDSGLRISEQASIKPHNIGPDNRLIEVWRRSNKESLAPFGERTEGLVFVPAWIHEHRDGSIARLL